MSRQFSSFLIALLLIDLPPVFLWDQIFCNTRNDNFYDCLVLHIFWMLFILTSLFLFRSFSHWLFTLPHTSLFIFVAIVAVELLASSHDAGLGQQDETSHLEPKRHLHQKQIWNFTQKKSDKNCEVEENEKSIYRPKKKSRTKINKTTRRWHFNNYVAMFFFRRRGDEKRWRRQNLTDTPYVRT